LLGVTENVKELAVLNGYAPGIDDETQLPQVERQLYADQDGREAGRLPV